MRKFDFGAKNNVLDNNFHKILQISSICVEINFVNFKINYFEFVFNCFGTSLHLVLELCSDEKFPIGRPKTKFLIFELRENNYSRTISFLEQICGFWTEFCQFNILPKNAMMVVMNFFFNLIVV